MGIDGLNGLQVRPNCADASNCIAYACHGSRQLPNESHLHHGIQVVHGGQEAVHQVQALLRAAQLMLRPPLHNFTPGDKAWQAAG